MPGRTPLVTPDSLCPACLGTGKRADELKLPADAEARQQLADELCRTCGGTGSLKR